MIVNAKSTTCNSNQKWNNEHVNVSVKIIILAKKNIDGILACVFVRITSIKKSITKSDFL